MPLHVVIAGAGLGGLVLARVLHRHGLSPVVLERAASLAAARARGQGGSLDLHPESGQRALADAGLTDRYLELARPEGEELRIVDPSGALLAHHSPRPAPDGPGAPHGRPEIDRSDLLDLLLESLPPHTVRWDSHVVEATVTSDGVRVRCADGDLLVGADGGRSVVRRLLSAVEPQPVGSTYLELVVEAVDEAHPELAALVGPGSLWAMGDGRILSAQRVGGRGRAHLRVAAIFGPTAPTPWETGATPDRRALAQAFSGWSPSVVALLLAAGEPVVQRTIAALPVGLTWPSQQRVTLVGDAAHLMPPVGEGANQAMLDGALLAQALVAHPGDPARAVASYEAEMFARTGPIAESSAQMQALLLSPTAGAQLARMFAGG